ncbi:MAG TPA: RNA polymerase subunit sigma-24, partial [Luteimonas sp.]|nr:RNA polymerase subunit sigma-24 [Luteimonas sp.]
MLTATVTDWLPDATRATDAATPADVDAALARSAAAGDTSAFEALYRRHAGRVLGVILRLVGHDRARAEDL